MPDEMENTDLMGRLTQLLAELRSRRLIAIGIAEVEHWNLVHPHRVGCIA